MTHLPEPPFARIGHAPQRDAACPLSRLADPRLVAASMAYLRDIATVAEASRRRAPAPASEDTPQNPPKGTPGGPKGGGRGAKAPAAEEKR